MHGSDLRLIQLRLKVRKVGLRLAHDALQRSHLRLRLFQSLFCPLQFYFFFVEAGLGSLQFILCEKQILAQLCELLLQVLDLFATVRKTSSISSGQGRIECIHTYECMNGFNVGYEHERLKSEEFWEPCTDGQTP